MKPTRAPALALALIALVASPAHAQLSEALRDQLPPPASRPVSFTDEVRPILDASCASCHGRGKSRGGFRIDTRETLLGDPDHDPVVIVGNSRDSYFIHLVSGLDPANVMPDKGTRLTADQVAILRAWIDQGVAWDPAISFGREDHRHLHPRQPDLPPPTGDLTHPVDRLVAAYLHRQGLAVPPPVEDRTFARRVHLDIVGLLPSPAELDAFLNDPRPDRRERLVDALLADRPRYAQHWLTFWNDLLRNDYRGTGYIDGGREQITQWLYSALRDNQPYDRFVRELVDPRDNGPRGFTKGIVWRGAINASQTPPMQAAQSISQVFLGVNLKCAACHDSFIDDWQLTDAYGLAAVYADDRLELVECDRPLGRFATVKFLFPELGDLPTQAPREDRIAQLAQLVTNRDNGRLSRTVVNRLWARFFGHGLVEPVDVMQNPAWDVDLLDWLAEDLVAHDYDLQRTMRQILTSRAYRFPSVDLPEPPVPDYTFRGPAVRRLTAEQFRDALGQLAGVWHDRPEGGVDGLLLERGPAQPPNADAFWIWSHPHAAEGVPPQTIHLRRTVELPPNPTEAVALVHVDNTHRLWINGREARRRNAIPWAETSVLDLRPFLRAGPNTFAVEAVNEGQGPNPAGFLFYARIRTGPEDNPGIHDFASDAAWTVSTTRVEGWQRADFQASDWSRAQILGNPGMAPWNVGAQFAAAVAGRTPYGQIRASLVAADPLTTALGRPNREQITSARPTTATTIQMLELTNGETLARILRQGAERLVTETPQGSTLVSRVFARSLGRPPTPDEATLSLALVGSQPRPDGVEDLLWSVVMLPEFQLIH
ncbi:MAG: DUF1549 domain-containing protein [Verrucomicrobiae bacterium]|nr:DUF1549 domain-containing protein [Verrucomicrobiae bacterium]